MRFHHYALEVDDLDESVAFYQKHLGFLEESRMMFWDEEIVFLVLSDFRLELIRSKRNGNAERSTHLCFEVGNLEEIINQFEPCRLLEGPYLLENGWRIVFFEGPNHEILEFLEAKGHG
ncbi:VOC family protein [Neobacillus dielmonensis]|uniref:VOC family protein n=1 Tax=Neobacillus dielmonensis TaxID=1347369 RepID=UPI0005AA8902|nr:VOC family protein [Neobacillus dielmonensis]